VETLTWVRLKEGRTACLNHLRGGRHAWPPCGGSNLGRVEGGDEDMLGPHVVGLTWVGLKEGRTTCLVPMWRL